MRMLNCVSASCSLESTKFVADGNQSNRWPLAGALVVLSVIFVVVAKLMLEPEPVSTPPRRNEAAPTPPPTPVHAEPLVPRDPPPSPPPDAEAPKPARQAPPSPACSQASDCRGPKTADCIVATCEAGRCVFDRSRCECVEDGECDDGVECTRDLCFAATRKCIHIRSACE